MRPGVPPASNPIASSLRAVWPNLPALLVGGSVVSASAILVAVLTPGITPLASLLWAIVVGPCFGALQAQVNDMALGFDVKPFSYQRYLRRYALMGLCAWTPAAVSAAIGLIALQWWIDDRAVIAVVPLVVSASVTALTGLGAIAALVIAIGRPDLRGIPLFLLALHVTARRPVPVVAVVAVVAIGFWAATTISASTLLLVPVPVAVTAFAAVWTSADAAGLVPRTSEIGAEDPAPRS